jgi:hypothetical protein
MKKKVLALVTVFCMMVTMMTACNNYSNIEGYYNANKATIEATFNSESLAASLGEGVTGGVSASGDELVMYVVLPDDIASQFEPAMLQESLDAAIPSMQPAVDELKNEAKLEKAIFTLRYEDASGNVIASSSIGDI